MTEKLTIKDLNCGNREPSQAWAVRNPFAKVPRILPFTIRRTRKEAIDAFCYDPAKWKKFYRWGYRVIKVTVRDDIE